MATTINAGRVRFVSRGTYNNSTQYYLFDLVDYNGSSYIAKENSLGNLPTNTQYWQLIAEKGDTYDDTELKNVISSINTNIKANYYNKADTDTKLDTKANTSDVYNKTEIDTKINAKQNKLTAGTGIEITGENTINNIQGNYSTEETKIGTWIDGKPLYRKTFNITSELSPDLNMPHNISNIDYCKCYGTLITGNISAEQFYANSTDYFRCFREGYFVKIRYGTSNGPTTIIINLEYTKTTD